MQRTGVIVRVVCAVGLAGGCTDSGPTPPAPAGYSSIATAAARSCSLDETGAAWCWGALGLPGATTTVPAPQLVDDALRFGQLAAYGSVVCGVATDGVGYCWGPNDHAQLGQGTIGPGSATPAIVGTSRPFASIAGGDATVCGITPTGEPLCWGSNALGQVGADAGPTDVQSPVALAGALRMTAISASRDFACGVTTDGEAYCWGSNAHGQLGNGGPITGEASDLSRVPTKVVGDHRWTAITTGDQFACGITDAGAAMCWGRNEARLGDGATAASSTPVAVAGGHRFTHLDAGKDFACGITGEGAALCWGANTHGQLGAGAGAPTTPSTTPIAVTGGLTFAEIRASDGDHTCAISGDRAAVYCWGRNDAGQLGTGATTAGATPTPTLVSGQGG